MINSHSCCGRGCVVSSHPKPSTNLVGLIAEIIIPKVPIPHQRALCLPLSSRHSVNPEHGAGQEEERRAGFSASPRGPSQSCARSMFHLISLPPPLHSSRWWSKQLPQSTQERWFSVEGSDSKLTWKRRHNIYRWD